VHPQIKFPYLLHPLSKTDEIKNKTVVELAIQVLSSSRDGRPFGHNRHGPKIKSCAIYLSFLGGTGSTSNTMSSWPRPTSVPSGILIHPAVWPQRAWAENWGLCPLFGGKLGPHLTQCGRGRGLSPCQVSSRSIQPFRHSTPTSQTDRTGRTGQRSDGIGRTVLQTVAQKCVLYVVQNNDNSHFFTAKICFYSRTNSVRTAHFVFNCTLKHDLSSS